MGFGCLQPGGGCCGGDVLIWDKTTVQSLNGLKAHYVDRGLTAHLWNEFSGTLSDYSLIFWLEATADPSWISDLASWAGRLHIGGEVPPGGSTSNTYVNALLATYSVSITIDDADGGIGTTFLPGAATDLAPANIFGNGYSTLTGGTSVYTHQATGGLMMSREQVGIIDWVVAGDDEQLSDAFVGSNSAFLDALYDA